jgi:hypothetical protein
MPLTNSPKTVNMARRVGLTSAPIVHGVEKASQTYKIGAFLIDDDAGRITESTSPIDASTAAKRTFGIAVAAATGTTSANTMVVWATDSQMFEITLSDATAGTHALVQNDQWKVYPILKDSTSGNWYLDANAVSDTGGGIVVEFKDPLGTVDARVFTIVTNTARGGANVGSGTY